MKFLLVLIASFLVSSSATAKEKPDYEQYRVCKIKAEISIERLNYTRAEAEAFCHSIHKIFDRGCSVRNLGHGRGWGSFFKNEWIFEGKGRTWSRAKQLAFSRYYTFSNKFGWGQSFPHIVSFSKCS